MGDDFVFIVPDIRGWPPDYVSCNTVRFRGAERNEPWPVSMMREPTWRGKIRDTSRVSSPPRPPNWLGHCRLRPDSITDEADICESERISQRIVKRIVEGIKVASE